MDLGLLEVETGESRRIFGEGLLLKPGSWSPDGTKLAVQEVRRITDSRTHLVDAASGSAEELTPHEGEANFFPGPWAPDGSGFYLRTDEDREFAGIAFQRLDGSREWVETPEGDVEGIALSADGAVLAWTVNDRGY